jgi:hypothetical protein
MKQTLYAMLIIMLLVGGCEYQNHSKQTFKDIDKKLNISETNRIELINGQTGKMNDITSKTEVMNFLKILQKNKFSRMDHKEVKGYRYAAKLVTDDKTINITFLSGAIKVNDEYYQLEKAISEQELSTFYRIR